MRDQIQLPDHQILERWQANFLRLNQGRLALSEQVLSPKQRRLLAILPVLLHVNHTRLPGYINRDVPAGFEGFSPTDDQRKELKLFLRGYALPTENKHCQLLGLYLIGSTGSIAQSPDSDFDVWLCLPADLDDTQQQLLEQKCQLLERWAVEQETELHIFCMNLDQFRAGQHLPMGSEHCGSSQHYLLLDEFYRSAIYLAGAMPSWWLLPPRYERRSDEYWQSLVTHHRVDADKYLDIGDISTIPAAEFFGASLWHMHKALHQPYKSLLKLALTGHYADQFPSIRPLCWDLKEKIHQGHVEPEHCDAYLLLLRRLQRTVPASDEGLTIKPGSLQPDMQLLQRAFYFKLGISLSQNFAIPREGWRYSTLQTLVEGWGWSKSLMQHLDQRQDWELSDLLNENRLLLDELFRILQCLSEFSHRHQSTFGLSIERHELVQLRDQLKAIYGDAPGKIYFINSGISNNLRQPSLTIECDQSNLAAPLLQRRVSKEHADQQRLLQWNLYSGSVTDVRAARQSPPAAKNRSMTRSIESSKSIGEDKPAITMLYQSNSVIEVLAFARLNRLFDSDTQISQLTDSVADHRLEHYPLRELIRAMLTIQPDQGRSVSTTMLESNEATARPGQTVRMGWLFINIGIDPQRSSHRQHCYTFSDYDDGLCYGGRKQNLCQSLDVLTVNDWGEWQVHRFQGQQTIISLLYRLAHQWHQCRGQIYWEQWQYFCFSTGQATMIQQRLKCLLDDLKQFLTRHGKSITNQAGDKRASQLPPYLLQLGNGFQLLHFSTLTDGSLADLEKDDLSALFRVESFTNQSQLFKALSSIKGKKNSALNWSLDRYAFKYQPLRAVLEAATYSGWQIFFWRQPQQLQLFICDDRGAITFQRYSVQSGTMNLLPLMRLVQFLQQLQHHWQWQNDDPDGNQLSVWQLLQRDTKQPFICEQQVFAKRESSITPIQLRAEYDQQLTLITDSARYSQQEYGARLYHQVVEHLLKSDRESLQDTESAQLSNRQWNGSVQDIHIARCWQLTQYLELRQQIEERLQQARAER